MSRQDDSPRRVTLVSPEVHPFHKTGGLGDVAGALPQALARAGAEVTVITPLFRDTQAPDLRSLAMAPFVLGGVEHQVEFLEGTMPGGRVRAIFINSPADFGRPGIYGEGDEPYADNPLRFALFGQAAALAAHRWCDPEILHLHDWTTGLIPLYLRTGDRMGNILERTRLVMTIHNLGYQGLFDPSLLGPMGIDPDLFHPEGIEFYGHGSTLKAGIQYSDLVTTVSPTYAREIQTPEYGCGMEGLLQAHADRLAGVLNGVDYGEWNPETDPHIRRGFSPSRMLGKSTNKTDLRAAFGLRKVKETPVVAVISRLVHQKGIDLVVEAAERIVERGGQLVVLGAGTPELEARVTALAERHPGRCGVRIGFDIPLSHRILAGADMLLLPSRYEPCGLTHLYGMKYGVVPVARATGGLRDTVVDVDAGTGEGTGFLFEEAEVGALQEALDRAFALYASRRKRQGRTAWNALRADCMRQDWSWDRIVPAYLDAYRELVLGREVVITRPPEGPSAKASRTAGEETPSAAPPSRG